MPPNVPGVCPAICHALYVHVHLNPHDAVSGHASELPDLYRRVPIDVNSETNLLAIGSWPDGLVDVQSQRLSL